MYIKRKSTGNRFDYNQNVDVSFNDEENPSNEMAQAILQRNYKDACDYYVDTNWHESELVRNVETLKKNIHN